MLYVFCVLIPLIVTDGFIIGMFVRNERNRVSKEMENLAETTANDFTNEFRHSINTANSIYSNSKITDFRLDDDGLVPSWHMTEIGLYMNALNTEKAPDSRAFFLCL